MVAGLVGLSHGMQESVAGLVGLSCGVQELVVWVRSGW